MVATVAFRGGVAIADAPATFEEFRSASGVRTPGEILAHIGDLLIGSHYLLKGEFVRLESKPIPWEKETKRFMTAVRELDGFLASDAPLAYPVEKFIQGPIGDALTHVGQLVMLRRMAGIPVREEPYFTADVIPGTF
jgi:hypothetical protein